MNTEPQPQPRPFSELQHCATRYEIVATDGSTTIRLGFTERLNKVTFFNMARTRGDAVSALLAPLVGDAEFAITYSRERGLMLGPVRVGKSGRTERDIASAIARGEET